MILINLQKVAPELTRPNGIVLNWNKPLGVSNAVRGLDLSVKPTCQ